MRTCLETPTIINAMIPWLFCDLVSNLLLQSSGLAEEAARSRERSVNLKEEADGIADKVEYGTTSTQS